VPHAGVGRLQRREQRGASNAPVAAISEISWKGLRCNLEVSGATAGLKADLRRESSSGPSVATTPKPIDAGGARLLIEADEQEGAVVMAVLISPEGRVVAQRRTVGTGKNRSFRCLCS
jgi:hypothetical protein